MVVPVLAVSVDGRRVPVGEATLSVLDAGVQRGDGVFEALRIYEGRPYALAAHLERLERSARALSVTLPARDVLRRWAVDISSDHDRSILRILRTRGSDAAPDLAPPRTIMTVEPLPPIPDAYHLLPMAAPWHPGGFPSPLAGVKSLSYAPNMAATRAAKAAGFDDALLLSREGAVLEGPTFSVAWVYDGRLETPALDLGILDSITRRAVLAVASEIGLATREVVVEPGHLTHVTEVLCLSTVREVAPVRAVGELRFEPGPVTARLADAFRSHVRRTLR